MVMFVLAFGAALLSVARGTHAQCEVVHLESPVEYPDDGFGAGLAIYGDMMVVGDYRYQDARGAVHLYQRVDGQWHLLHTIDDPPVSIGAKFGSACDLNDEWLVVGAQSDDHGDDPTGTVFVYRYDQSGVALVNTFMGFPSRESINGGNYGYQVAISNDRLAVSWPGFDLSRGRVDIYRLETESWQFEQAVQSPSTASSASFGRDLALTTEALAISSPGADLIAVFRRNGKTWTLDTEFQLNAAIGLSVDICGNTVAFGEPVAGPGNVHLSYYEDGVWLAPEVVTTKNNDGLRTRFGDDLALGNDGQTLAVGAPLDMVNGFNSGAVHLFQRSEGSWNETAKLTPQSAFAGEEFGWLLVLENDTLVATGFDGPTVFVGAHQIDSNNNGIADSCEAIEGDLDGDGVVDINDLITLLAQWGVCDQRCIADLDGNGMVDFDDLLILLGGWTI